MDIALTITLALTCACFTGIWLINVMTKDAGVIDYYWGPGFAAIAAIHFYIHGSGSIFEWILLTAVVVWSVRLAGYLIRRHHGSDKEDGRYLEMRETGGPNFWWSSLFKVFLLQAALLWVIAAPLHVAFGASVEINPPLFWIGFAIYTAGFVLEWVSDHQLAVGKREGGHAETGTSMFAGGLWAKSRHPNYLGELLLWWGLSIAAFAMSGAFIAFAGPAILTLVVIGVSIPLTEQHMVRSRPSYGAYQKTVPMLLPIRALNSQRSGNQPAE